MFYLGDPKSASGNSSFKKAAAISAANARSSGSADETVSSAIAFFLSFFVTSVYELWSLSAKMKRYQRSQDPGPNPSKVQLIYNLTDN